MTALLILCGFICGIGVGFAGTTVTALYLAHRTKNDLAAKVVDASRRDEE